MPSQRHVRPARARMQLITLLPTADVAASRASLVQHRTMSAFRCAHLQLPAEILIRTVVQPNLNGLIGFRGFVSQCMPPA